jgi:hypothetical protein
MCTRTGRPTTVNRGETVPGRDGDGSPVRRGPEYRAHLATIVDGIHGAPPEQVRPARRLLIFASLATLALNIADPIVTSDYGKAAFDSVGPLLLIGWAGSRPRAATGHRRYQAPAIGGQAC